MQMNRSGYNQNRMQRPAYRNPGCGARMEKMQEQAHAGCGAGAERMKENSCGVCGARAEGMPEHTHAACGARTECMQGSGCGGTRTERMQDSGRGGMRTERMQDSGCGGTRTERVSETARMTCDCTCRIDLPTDRCKLLEMIDEVSFGAYEALLYLDTHPQDEEAMRYFCEHNEKRNMALREYTRLYGPLNLMMPGSNKDCWEWMSQPWPWEGGDR